MFVILAIDAERKKEISANLEYYLREHPREKPVHFTTFVTDTPLAHLQRALDELGRCGFDLCAVTMAPGRAGAEVRIEFRPCGTVRADTLVARIARMPEIGAVEAGLVDPMVAREAD